MHPCIYWIVLSSLVINIIGDNYKAAFGCLEDEKIGLLKLKDFINHHNSIVPPTWGDKQVEDCCKWEGVICNENDDVFSKRIINLYLSPSFMGAQTFDLDASLFQPFEELQNLTISNMIQGVKGALRLPKLQVLDLHDNNVMSHVPLMGELQSLKFLDLSQNSINDDDFQELTNLSSLELLNLDGNRIAGKIPPSIWALTSLKMLGFSDNWLNGSLPKELCTLTNLEELDLSGNKFEGIIPTCLSNLTSLRLLDLSYNKFSGSIPSNLFSSLKSLEYVSLSFNHFDGLISFSSFADNFKLKVFELRCYKPNLKVETENTQWKPPYFQLEILRIVNCIVNEPVWVIPSFLVSQYDLRYVDLSHNGMSGEIPSWLITNNSKLEHLNLQNNRFHGQLMLQLDAYNAYMSWLDISMNQVAGEIPSFIGSILPNLNYLDMSTNAIIGSIPTSIKNMRSLQSMDLSNNQLSGELNGKLFDGCEELTTLKLSNNSLRGNLTNFLSNTLLLPQLNVLKLDNNKFSGDLRLETLSLARGSLLTWLDISNNLITGRFPDWIAELSQLGTLGLSKNRFQGKLPTSFCKIINIAVLDLSWNNFSDTLPPCTNLSMLQSLDLQGNGFHGQLPTFLSRSSTISTMNVRDNKFSGLIPAWINLLPDLTFLLLRGNVFHGSIPSEICQLKNLRILDFAANNLSGSVPPCLSQIPFGKKDLMVPENYMSVSDKPLISLPFESQLHMTIDTSERWHSNSLEEVQFITKSVLESYPGSILNSIVGIDLSLNRLTGPIPMHFGNWDHVRSLNLSYNYFNESIPVALSSLIKLESLDLSHNMLGGQIPSEMTHLTSLSAFSVAYNNLSGPIPKSNQFGTFEAKNYDGNFFLCGPPLERSCSGGPTKMPHAKLFVEPQQNDSSFKDQFLWTFFGSFVVSCIGAFVFFYFVTNIPQTLLQWIGVEERIHHRRTVELPWKWINQ